jgi:hypothetical protein
MYLQGHEATDPLASPLFAGLDAWPRTLLFAITGEVLLDDTLACGDVKVELGIRTTVAGRPPWGVPARDDLRRL